MVSTGTMQEASAMAAPTLPSASHPSSTTIVRPSSSSFSTPPQQHLHSHHHQHHQLPSPLSLGPPPSSSHSQPLVNHGAMGGPVVTIAAVAHPPREPMATPLARVRFSDLIAYDGAPTPTYLRAVEALSGSLMRHNAAIIELGTEDAALMRCGLEASRLYFRTRSQNPGKGSRGAYIYRAGR